MKYILISIMILTAGSSVAQKKYFTSDTSKHLTLGTPVNKTHIIQIIDSGMRVVAYQKVDSPLVIIDTLRALQILMQDAWYRIGYGYPPKSKE